MTRSLEFATDVRVLATVARQHGLDVPAFRSACAEQERPWQVDRRPQGYLVAAVQLNDRTRAETVRDCATALMEANGLPTEHPAFAAMMVAAAPPETKPPATESDPT